MAEAAHQVHVMMCVTYMKPKKVATQRIAKNTLLLSTQQGALRPPPPLALDLTRLWNWS